MSLTTTVGITSGAHSTEAGVKESPSPPRGVSHFKSTPGITRVRTIPPHCTLPATSSKKAHHLPGCPHSISMEAQADATTHVCCAYRLHSTAVRLPPRSASYVPTKQTASVPTSSHAPCHPPAPPRIHSIPATSPTPGKIPNLCKHWAGQLQARTPRAGRR